MNLQESSSLTGQALSHMRNGHLIFTDINFNLNAGDIAQITGCNGSGKTSLLRLLAGLSWPETGQVLWDEQDIYQKKTNYNSVRQYIGHLPSIKHGLTVAENVRIMRHLVTNPASITTEAILVQLKLSRYQNDYCYQLSAGQKRRVALCALLLSQAKLWLLDEPLSALDTQGIALIQSLMLKHCERGGIVMFTTHQPIILSSCQLIQISLDEPI